MSTDLSQTHLKTSHVVAIIVAVVSAGIAVAGAYFHVILDVKDLARAQQDIPTKHDLEKAKTELSVDLTHAASERVRFYLEHSVLECSRATGKDGKQHCKLVWPLPEPPN